ncbi:MAG: hypothetical protein KJ000_10615 [Pirellulaceae bacterium]|nr:hypothetical protein [Pirellulaceae bacterium]
MSRPSFRRSALDRRLSQRRRAALNSCHRQLRFEPLEDRRMLAVFVVNSTLGLGDSFPNDEICDTEHQPNADPPIPPSGVCTLRAALEQAATTDGSDELRFAIPGGGVPVIDINAVMNAGSVEIDGTTQPGSGKVEIRGILSLSGDGQHTVRGLVFNDGGLILVGNGNTVVGSMFGTTPAGDALGAGSAGLEITGDNNQIGGTGPEDRNIVVGDIVIAGNNNRVFGNYIGVDVTGEIALDGPNTGVRITGGMDNQVGGDTPAHGNVFAAGGVVGAIFVEKPGVLPEAVPQTIIRHNFIGTNKDGTRALPNNGPGIVLSNAPNAAVFDNVIAASEDGIIVRKGTNLAVIQRNRIGTDATGTVTDPDGVPGSGDEFGNRNAGILLNAEGLGATGNVIGGSLGEQANVISGNEIGIRIFNFADGNHVEGNLIGVNAAGTAPLPNRKGIEIEFASHNIVGGLRPNVVSGNTDFGIVIAGLLARDNLVANNRIGTNADGTAAIANGTGVLINDAPGNCIGGILPGQSQPPQLCADLTSSTAAVTGNVISGNVQYGVRIVNGNALGNIVQANRIGANDLGMAAVPNGFDGVAIDAGADVNLIGGAHPNRRNVISGNTGDGVLVVGLPANASSGNAVSGNYIGVDATGAGALPNGARGIHLDAHVTHTLIGGELPGARNTISGNALDGVIVAFATTFGTRFQNNYIGTDSTGQHAVPNQRHGIRILGSPNNLIGEVIGTSGLGNVISGNKLSGVRIEGATATDNVLVNNAIGTDASRTQRVKNEEFGVYILNAPENRIGGSFASSPVLSTFVGNVVSGNASAGVKIEGSGANGNVIGANLIGLDGSGLERLANGGEGIHIVDAADTRIGASMPNEPPLSGNTISANLNGIRIDGAGAVDTLIGDNRIGTDWQGDPGSPPRLGNTVDGIWIRGASETYVGGLFLRDGQALQLPGNTISANLVGVRIEGDTARFNKIQRNSIFGNVNLGIDLGAAGVTANDEDNLDGDDGPNDLQNFPVVERYTAFDASLRGRLISKAGETFTIDVYKNRSLHSSEHGEGEVWVGEFTVQTGANGVGEFIWPVVLDPVFKWLTLTATDAAGNTSEFSGPLRQADLTIDAFSIHPVDVVRDAPGYVLPFEVTVRNIGTATAQFAELRFWGNNQILHGTETTVTLAPGESQVVTGTWNITPWLQAFPRGVAAIELKAAVDPDNLIEELPVGPNERSSLMTADARPRITAVHKEFAEGVFLEDVSLENTIGVLVDWNGNLDGVQIGQGDLPDILFQLNGVETLPDGPVSLSEFTPTNFTINMGTDLTPVDNLIRIWARLRGFQFESEPESIRYDQFATVPWIESPLWMVREHGGPNEKTAEYKARIFVPQAATAGSFDVPADRVGVAGGAFGPAIPQAAVTAIIRSDRTSRIEGEFKMEGEVTDKKFGGVGSSITGKAAGEFSFGDSLDLKKLEAVIRGDATVKSPKVPLAPYLPWVRAQATIGVGVDAKLEWEEDANGDLAWKPNLILGLEPNAELALIFGYDGATVELAGGGRIRGEFSLAGDPCVPIGGRVTLYARVKAEVWIFEASRTFAWVENLPVCGALGEGETTSLPDAKLADDIRLLPRFVPQTFPHEGEAATAGLPTIAYPYAQPALAQRGDGTMTLVYVSEDPTKADGQHLEVFASHYDGAAWSPPVQLTDDTFLDDAPSVVYDADGNAIAVWTRINATLTDPAQTDPHSLLADLELVYAVWDAAAQTWSAPAALTSDDEMDHWAHLARGADGTVMAVWQHDSGNDMPLFPDDDTRPLGSDLLFSTWNGANWSPPAVAVSGVKTGGAPQLALGDGDGVLVWSDDADGNMVTDADRDVRAVLWDGSQWSAPVTLGTPADGYADVAPRVAVGLGGEAIITWVKTGVPVADDADDFEDQVFGVEVSAGSLTAAQRWLTWDNVTEPHLLTDPAGNAVLVWQGRSDAGPDILFAVRDADSGEFGAPTALTETPQYEWSLNPFFNSDGELEVLYLVRELGTEAVPQPDDGSEGESHDLIEIPTFLGSSLASTAALPGPDLAVETLTLDPPVPLPGSDVQVSVTVGNRGSLRAPASSAVLLDDGVPVSLAQQLPSLAAGETVTIDFVWSVPVGAAAPRVLTTMVDPQNEVAETDETNNEMARTVLRPDLAIVSVASVHQATGLVVTAVVVNQGDSPAMAPFGIALRLDDPEAANLILHTVADPLAPGATETVVFTIQDPTATLLRSRVGWVVADAGNAVDESDEDNNLDSAGLHPFLSWQNQDDRFDVSGVNGVTPEDVLLLINRINATSIQRLPVPPSPPFFFDVDGDGALTPLDVLLVINLLNDVSAQEPEGEGAEAGPVARQAGQRDVVPRPDATLFAAFDSRDQRTVAVRVPAAPRLSALPAETPSRIVADDARTTSDHRSPANRAVWFFAAGPLPTVSNDLDDLETLLDEILRPQALTPSR